MSLRHRPWEEAADFQIGLRPIAHCASSTNTPIAKAKAAIARGRHGDRRSPVRVRTSQAAACSSLSHRLTFGRSRLGARHR